MSVSDGEDKGQGKCFRFPKKNAESCNTFLEECQSEKEPMDLLKVKIDSRVGTCNFQQVPWRSYETDHQGQVGTTWEDSKTRKEARGTWLRKLRRFALCRLWTDHCAVFKCVWAWVWVCVVSNMETLEGVPNALENTGEHILSEGQDRNRDTCTSKQSPSFRSNPAWPQSPQWQTCQPASQTLEKMLCAKRARDTWWWGKSRESGVVTGTVQRFQTALGSCSVVARVDRERLPLSTDIDTHHGAFWRYIKLEMREISRCQNEDKIWENTESQLGSGQLMGVSGMNIGLGSGSEILMSPWGQDALGLDVIMCWDCCCCSVAKSYPTLCDPMEYSIPGFSVLHHLLEFAQTHVYSASDAIQPSHSLPSLSLPALNLSQHQGLFQGVISLHQVTKVLKLQLQHQSCQWIFSVDFL